MTLRLQVLTRVSQAEQLADFWEELAPTPMQSPRWLLPWWQAHRTRQSRLQLLKLSTQTGEVVGLVPLYHHESWSSGASLRFLGSGQACSDFQTLLCRDNYRNAVAEATADWIYDTCNRGGWGYCEFDGVSAGDDCMRLLCDEFRRLGLLMKQRPIESSWRLALQSDWKDVLQLQSKTQRRQSRNLLNRLDKSEHLRVAQYSGPAVQGRPMEELVRLHQAHWEDAGKPGCFSDPRFEKFIVDASKQLKGTSHFLIRTLYSENQPAASQLLLIAEGKAYVYQSGRDPLFDDQRVGRILNLDTARWLSANGFEFLDYLRGDEIYKSRMGAAPTGLKRIRVVAPNARHLVTHASTEIGRSLKHSVRTLAKLTGIGLGS